MEELTKYCRDKAVFNDVEIYIVKKELYGDMLNDIGVLRLLGVKDKFNSHIRVMMEYATKVSEVKCEFAFVHHPKRTVLQWEPTNLIEYENKLYPVDIRKNWLCMDCGHSTEGIIFVPKYGICGKYECADIFKKIRCKKCGALLQNYLLILDRTGVKP